MKVLVEFGKSRSASWPWILRQCRRQPSYRVQQDEGLEVHSVTFDQAALRPALVLIEKLRSWRTVSIFIDGEPAGPNEAWSRIYRVIHRRANVDGALDQLSADLNEKLKDSGQRLNIRVGRGQQRSGPDPELGF